jgi:hypothetical protein
MKVKKHILTLLVLAITGLGFSVLKANMAAPSLETKAHSAIASKDLHIINETVHLKINEGYSGYYRVVYNIRADKSGTQIPFLFHALDFGPQKQITPKVTLDGKPAALTYVDSSLSQAEMAALLQDFSNYARTVQGGKQTADSFIYIFWNKNENASSGYNPNSQIYALRELLFFKLDIAAGTHQIVVEYPASSCELRNGTGAELFRYSLQPARYWKSFGGMTFELEVPELAKSVIITSSLGKPHRGSLETVAYWDFEKLPADYIHINLELKMWDRFVYSGNLGWLCWMLISVIAIWIQYRRIRLKYRNNKVSNGIKSTVSKLLFYISISMASGIIFLWVQYFSNLQVIAVLFGFFLTSLCQIIVLMVSDFIFNRYFKSKYAIKN